MDMNNNKKVYKISDWNQQFEKLKPNTGRENEKPVFGVDWRPMDAEYQDKPPGWLHKLKEYMGIK